jgi:hypothetical protein
MRAVAELREGTRLQKTAAWLGSSRNSLISLIKEK